MVQGKYIRTPDILKRQSDAHKGRIPWNKGISRTDKEKENISKSMMGKHPSEKTRMIWRDQRGGEKNSFYGIQRFGEDNPNWKGGITPLYQIIRNSNEYFIWRDSVFKRDAYTCLECGLNKSGFLEAHHKKYLHIILKENFITTFESALQCQELWNINNGITLCEECHNKLPKHDNFKGDLNDRWFNQ